MPRPPAAVPSARSSHEAGAEFRCCPSRGRPVDLVHLARQTSGDRALEREILELFDRQLELFGERMDQASGDEMRSIAHALCGASRNVGAFTLGDAARALELGTGPEAACRARLASELQRARAFIRPLL